MTISSGKLLYHAIYKLLINHSSFVPIDKLLLESYILFIDLISMKHTKKLLVALFIIAFLVRYIAVFVTPIKIWDETVYVNLGTDLSRNLLDYSFSHGWSDFIPIAQNDLYGYPNAGFRAPLLPYLLAFLNILQLAFLINFFMPFIGALSVILVYWLGKELFNKKIGFIAAIFFAFIPLHVEYSSRVLTDALVTFFVLLSFVSFWKGFEKGNYKYKIFFGIFLALSLLSRYTALWIFPVFLLYAVIRGKLVQFLRDKYFWFSMVAFVITLLPWLIYGVFTYKNPLGPFIHGAIASNYWGGVQSWYYFFIYWWQMFSVIGFIFVFSLFFLIYKKDFLKKEIYLLFLLFIFFLGFAIYQPHKEERFLLPIVPALVLISAYTLEKFKKYTNRLVLLCLGFLLVSIIISVYKLYADNHNVNTSCYQQVGAKLHELQGNFLVVSENSSLFRSFAEQENIYYPAEITETTIQEVVNSTDKKILFVFTKYNSGFETKKWKALNAVMKKNYDLIFECPQNKDVNWIYLKAELDGLTNLIPNNSFEIEGDNSWVTNTSQFVTVDNNKKGSGPTSIKSAKLIGSSKEADLHTALIPVQQNSLYEFKVFTNTRDMPSGELGFIIDEYTESNQWIRAKWIGNATPKTAGYIVTLYTPDSSSVHAIRIHAYLAKNTKGIVYLDNYQFYKLD